MDEKMKQIEVVAGKNAEDIMDLADMDEDYDAEEWDKKVPPTPPTLFSFITSTFLSLEFTITHGLSSDKLYQDILLYSY